MDPRIFDLDLFRSLNDEYRERPVATPVRGAAKSSQAQSRAARLNRLCPVAGKRVLELGCGRGEVAHELVNNYNCEVVAVDVRAYDEWSEREHPKLTFRELDLSQPHDLPPGSIDIVCSWSVMEHVPHPFAMLRACRDLMSDTGRFLLIAHLYRSATGSHRTSEIFFPFPHLLFTDDVFEAYYKEIGKPPSRPSWLNKLTYADYFRYFDLLGLTVEREFPRVRELDTAFFDRFSEELSKYANFDLERNAVEVVLSKRKAPPATSRPRVRQLVRGLRRRSGRVLRRARARLSR
jgi:SAM-dependent methyltransferase